MKRLLIVAVATTFAIATAAHAETCKTNAAGKNLHGAALTSFMKKCTRDATASCNAQAKSQKLHGAAMTSFTKKCVRDNVGP